ncbi:hypothetical protein MMYC01_206923 [Madurella mycetomatis]|uniref:DUF7598 domain-containing protein n=1 Tax=Madurella mycetomatis TaxID=100816 RepID=A0A175VXN6_9PEZI|nr:hypothetical protein MMYC01_206923 [Madurella mycetomatis]
MFNFATNPKVMGSGHLALNALRVLTLITLGVMMASSWIMIAFSGINHHFQFFDAATHFFVFAICVVLVLSELNLKFTRNWFEINWPGLSPGHSLVWLGAVLIVIGCQIMGDLVKPAYTIETIGLTFWRVILAAGILSITFGFFNIIASIIYRDSSRGIYARGIRSDGSLAQPTLNSKNFYDGYPATDYSSSHRDNFSQRSYSKEEVEEPSAVKRLTRVFNPRNFRKSRIQISKPIPQDVDVDVDCEPGLSRASPILPDVQRPPTALHPALTGSSRYSEAHLDRF